MLCPSSEILILFAKGEIEGDLREEIADHLFSTCYSCQEKLKWYEDVASTLNSQVSDNPDLLMDELQQLFEETMSAEMCTPAILFATPVFDSFGMSRVGARSAKPSKDANRRLLYHVGGPKSVSTAKADLAGLSNGCDVDLSVKRLSESNYSVMGQVLFKNNSDREACKFQSANLYRSGEFIVNSEINNRGGFSFSDLSEGHYSVQIKTPGSIIVIGLSVFPST